MTSTDWAAQVADFAGKTLEEIDGQNWPMPCCASYIEATCAALRKKPLGAFTVEDLRMMVAQDIGAEVLKAFVLVKLQENPLAEGDYCPGDLLEAAARRWPDNRFLRDLAQQHDK